MSRFSAPANWHFDSFTNQNNYNIRYGYDCVENPDLNCVILPGNKEPIEKYFEAIKDFRERKPDWNMWAIDWLGHGKSDRVLAKQPYKMHIKDYKYDTQDLHQWLGIIEDYSDAPIVTIGHSRGGHLAMRYLAEYDYEHNVSASINTAPMLDIHLPFNRGVAKKLAAFYNNFRDWGERFVPAHSTWNPVLTQKYLKKRTHDKERCQNYYDMMNKNQDLIIDDVTMGWLDATFESMDWLLKEENISRINVPVLLFSAEKDGIVKNESHHHVANCLGDLCQHITIYGSYHNLWMETDTIRNTVIEMAENFIEKQVLSVHHQYGKNNFNNSGQELRPTA